MWTIVAIKNLKYLIKHSYRDYLAENDNEEGIHLGRLALLKKRYGEKVTQESFLDLTNYKENQKLKIKDKNKNYGTEFVFSAPKDWSILFHLCDENTRAKMQKEWNATLIEATKVIEENTFYRKKVKGKVIYEQAKAVEFAVFNHHTARTIDDRPDMQMHAHITTAPKVLGQDGKYYSHTHKDLPKEKSADEKKKQATLHLFDQFAQARLAKFVQEDLGLNVIRGVNDSFKIEGFTEEQRKFFSKRSEQVKDDLGENSTPAERQKAITQKRNKKDDYDLKVLRGIWQSEFKQLGMNVGKLKKGQKEQARSFNEVFKDVKFIDTKLIRIYALSESKFSKKSYEDLFNEYRNNPKLKEFSPGKFINLNHKDANNFNKNFHKGKLKNFQNINTSSRAPKPKQQGKKTAEARLHELEAEHQAKIIQLSSSKNSLSKLSEEQASFEQRKNALIEEIAREAQSTNDFSM